MKNIFEYDVFLSFASADKEYAKPIWQKLSLSGLSIFWSDETLKQNIGQPWFDVIQSALIQSKHFVLLASSQAMQSEWVKQEYQTFYSECFINGKGERRLVLFPIKDFDLSTLPPLLKNLQVAKKLDEMIFILGGVDVESLKRQSLDLQQKLKLAYAEIKNLQYQQKSISLPEQVIQERFESVLKEKASAIKRAGELEQQIMKMETELKELRQYKSSLINEQKDSIHSSPIFIFRSEPTAISKEELQIKLKEFDLFEPKLNANGSIFPNNFQIRKSNGVQVIIDLASNLMWKPYGPKQKVSFDQANKYVKECNREGYAGFHDWRLPTVLEAITLIEKEKRDNGFYISSIFDKEYWYNGIWTCDIEEMRYKKYTLTINFEKGYIEGVETGEDVLFSFYCHVRVVRSIK